MRHRLRGLVGSGRDSYLLHRPIHQLPQEGDSSDSPRRPIRIRFRDSHVDWSAPGKDVSIEIIPRTSRGIGNRH